MHLTNRIFSIDIFRGVTIAAMILVNTPGDWNHVYNPLSHAAWHGFTPTDLIFPAFLFVMGVSIHLAFKNKKKSKFVYKKLTIRSIKLFVLGLLINMMLVVPPILTNLENFRYLGVLQRIGIVYFFSTIIYLNLNWKSIVAICVAVLFSYWLWLGYIPIAENIFPSYERVQNNWALFVDKKILGTHMWKQDYDPEGIVSTIPAIISCLMGILAAKILESKKKLLPLFGLILLTLGYVLNAWFPINKSLWTSSFVLVSSAWCYLLLFSIDFLFKLKHFKFLTIFLHTGMNAILIYVFSSIVTILFYVIQIKNTSLHAYLFESLVSLSQLSEKNASLLYGIAVMSFYLIVGYILFRKRIFIKI